MVPRGSLEISVVDHFVDKALAFSMSIKIDAVGINTLILLGILSIIRASCIVE